MLTAAVAVTIFPGLPFSPARFVCLTGFQWRFVHFTNARLRPERLLSTSRKEYHP
jgi:hypothetical protein